MVPGGCGSRSFSRCYSGIRTWQGTSPGVGATSGVEHPALPASSTQVYAVGSVSPWRQEFWPSRPPRKPSAARRSPTAPKRSLSGPPRPALPATPLAFLGKSENPNAQNPRKESLQLGPGFPTQAAPTSPRPFWFPCGDRMDGSLLDLWSETPGCKSHLPLHAKYYSRQWALGKKKPRMLDS